MARYPTFELRADPNVAKSASPEQNMLCALIARAVDDYFRFKRDLQVTTDTPKIRKRKEDNFNEVFNYLFGKQDCDSAFTLEGACSYLSERGADLAAAIREHIIKNPNGLNKLSVTTYINPETKGIFKDG